MEKNKKKLCICKTSLAILGVLAIMLMLKYLPDIIELTLSLDKFQNYILSMGSLGVFVYIFLQMLQVVIAPIPGEVIQIAGGYIYGVPFGMIYTIAGLLLGASMAFYFTRFLGGSLVERILQKKKFSWMESVNDRKFSTIMFIVFFIPGLPKDFLIYVAGLTPIKPINFFVILLVSRFPWLLASVSIGSNIYHENYIPTIIISVLAAISFIFGIIYKDKIINKFNRMNSTV